MTLGLKDLYYAGITMTNGIEVYGTPKLLANAMSADLSVTLAEAVLYADDALDESVKAFVSGTLKLGIKELSNTALADILGQAVDDDDVVWAGEDTAPYVAVGFRALKADGTYRYVWLQKVQFKVPGEKYTTKGATITFNTPEIEGTFYKTKGTNKWKADFVGLETATPAKTWFTTVKTFSVAA